MGESRGSDGKREVGERKNIEDSWSNSMFTV